MLELQVTLPAKVLELLQRDVDLSTLVIASTVASATIGIGLQIGQNLSSECSGFLDLVVTFTTDELHVFEGVAGHRVFSVKYGSVS